MFWGKKHDEAEAQPVTTAEQQEVFPRGKLPPQLQQMVDQDDGLYDDLYSSYSVDSTDTPYRYAGYANRIRTILLSAHRYVAYTSDIGESFRPVAHPYLVRAAYGVSWTYLIGDVAHEGYKAYLRNQHALAPSDEAYKDASHLSPDQTARGMAAGTRAGTARDSNGAAELTPWPTAQIPLLEDYRVVMAKRAVFQSLASMGLPAFTIHSVVKYSGKMMKNNKNVFMRTWTPIGLGLAIVPFLPYIFDEPVDEAVNWSFKTAIRAYAGDAAVRPLPITSHAHTSPETAATLDADFPTLGADTGAGPAASAGGNVSWDEYQAERRKAKEERRRQREASGEVGLLGWLGLKEKEKESAESKRKTE